jgi:hypothetical protein
MPRHSNKHVSPHNGSVDPPKSPEKVIEISQPQDALARTEVLVECLRQGNDLLAAALVRMRDFYLAGAPPMIADSVLAQVETALARAVRARNGF